MTARNHHALADAGHLSFIGKTTSDTLLDKLDKGLDLLFEIPARRIGRVDVARTRVKLPISHRAGKHARIVKLIPIELLLMRRLSRFNDPRRHFQFDSESERNSGEFHSNQFDRHFIQIQVPQAIYNP